jgi:hypothetical protein
MARRSNYLSALFGVAQGNTKPDITSRSQLRIIIPASPDAAMLR